MKVDNKVQYRWGRVGVCGFLLVLAAIVLVGRLASRVTSHQEDARLGANGGLHIPKEALNFGEVWAASNFCCDVPLYNITSEAIQVAEFESSCGCVAVEPKRALLSPGGQQTLRLTLDLENRKSNSNNSAESRDFSVTVIPVTIVNGSLHRHEGWKIQGKVRDVVVLSPQVVTITETLVRGEGPPYSCIVSIHSGFSLASCLATCPGRFAKTEISQLNPQEKPNDYKLCIQLQQTMPSGLVSFETKVTPVGLDGKRYGAVILPVKGRMVDPVEPFPNPVVLGNRAVGDRVREVITFTRHTKDDFRLRKVESVWEDIVVSHDDSREDGLAVDIHVSSTVLV